VKFEEIVDFVLKFHNCHRQYEVVECLKNAIESLDQETLRLLYKSMNVEHGITSKTERDTFIRALPCMESHNALTDKFLIVIFPSFWKETIFERIRSIIHEARHIVDYPRTLKPNSNLDFLLMDAFLKTLEPSEGKAILKKELRDLNLNPNLLS